MEVEAADSTVVRIDSEYSIVTARQRGRAIAQEVGFGLTDLALITTVISELARNIVNYAGRGQIELSTTGPERPGVVIVALPWVFMMGFLLVMGWQFAVTGAECIPVPTAPFGWDEC